FRLFLLNLCQSFCNTILGDETAATRADIGFQRFFVSVSLGVKTITTPQFLAMRTGLTHTPDTATFRGKSLEPRVQPGSPHARQPWIFCAQRH
ncbi:hypothetical protein LH454_15565, partial [Laribacter hongkongensis]